MSHYQTAAAASQDLVSHVLKWILLAVAIICFALFFWATAVTYERAPPQPGQVVATDGTAVMNATDIVAGKAGFQKADLMDYGSLYGMGSYFGQDYTAFALMRIATLTEENLAEMRFGKGFGTLASEQQASVRDAMRRDLQGIDLTKAKVTLPQEVAAAIGRLRSDIAENLGKRVCPFNCVRPIHGG